MKNKFFNIFNTIAGLLFFSFLLSSSLTLNVSDIDKFEIENNLNAKITNVIGNFYNSNQFAVTSNVLLFSANNKLSSSFTSFGALELEGILPSVPQKSEDDANIIQDDYQIQIKDITIWLDSELDVINAQQNIKKFLFESIDWLENCENCLKFRSKQFPGTNRIQQPFDSQINDTNIATEDDIRILEDNIAYLTEQIEKYEENNGNEKSQWMIDFLNRALQEEKELNSNLSDQIIENAKNVIRRDSSIIMNTTMGQKEIAETAMKENSRIVEKVSDNQFENNRYMLIVLFVLIGIVVLLVLLSFFNKGPKTVYLKPKNNIGNNIDNTNHNDIPEPTPPSTNPDSDISSINVQQTKAYEDDSVIQSDLKSIKQSAVKMSVGQKHEASQIVKDWLDDGGSDDQDNQETDEESK
tara:strand:+ start:561 stop:1793 length:1233 start_codon:yes stop_codon:yes gene_type:complete